MQKDIHGRFTLMVGSASRPHRVPWLNTIRGRLLPISGLINHATNLSPSFSTVNRSRTQLPTALSTGAVGATCTGAHAATKSRSATTTNHIFFKELPPFHTRTLRADFSIFSKTTSTSAFFMQRR
jgi:hypothetical protein